MRLRCSSGGRRLGRLAGARPSAAPYHTNKIYLTDNRPDDGMPIEISRFTTVINDLNGVWHIVAGSVRDYDYRWRFIENINDIY